MDCVLEFSGSIPYSKPTRWLALRVACAMNKSIYNYFYTISQILATSIMGVYICCNRTLTTLLNLVYKSALDEQYNVQLKISILIYLA